MSRHLICIKLVCTAGLIGLLTVVPGARTGSAQTVSDMVRSLNNVLNPGDAQRLEDQARRNHRPQEERYWRDYRAVLESPDQYRRDYPDKERGDYRSRATTVIGATKAIKAIATTGATIATNEIIATINARNRNRQPDQASRLPFQTGR